MACTSAALNTLDSTGNVGGHTSVTIGADGLGLISYSDWTNGDLRVAHCNDVACTGATLSTVDSGGGAIVGTYCSITVGQDGLGLISYLDATNLNLKVAHCNDAACTSAVASTMEDTADIVGQYTSVTIGSDGLPLISYYRWTGFDLKVAHCANAFCTPYFRRR